MISLFPFARYVAMNSGHLHFRLSVTRYNQYGEQTVRKKAATVNFINAMRMW